MKIKILIKIMNNLDRTHVYQYADNINQGRKSIMKKAKSNPYEWYEFRTIKGKYIGSLQYRGERKDFVWSGYNVTSSRIAKKVRPDGSLGDSVKLW